MGRRVRIACAAAALAATPLLAPLAARAQVAIDPPAPAPVASLPEDVLAIGFTAGRMTVPVSIGERGPWNFLIDTGAERTVLSHELASVLALSAGPPLKVIAMTGASPSASVIVPALSVSTIAAKAITAPALEGRYIGGPGLLGIDALQGHAVAIDFDRNEMALRPSRKRHVDAGRFGDEVVVVARSLFGQLIVTDAQWRGNRIAVVLDTGSSLTIGNPALLALMQRRARGVGRTVAVSVTGRELVADAFLVDDVTIGGIGFNNVSMAFADAAPFRRFGLEGRPALMLGMDTLRLFRRVQIDFANRSVRFTLPRSVVTQRTDIPAG